MNNKQLENLGTNFYKMLISINQYTLADYEIWTQYIDKLTDLEELWEIHTIEECIKMALPHVKNVNDWLDYFNTTCQQFENRELSYNEQIKLIDNMLKFFEYPMNFFENFSLNCKITY